MGERVNILKKTFEKRLNKLKNRTVLIQEEVNAACGMQETKDYQLDSAMAEKSKKTKKRLNRAKRKVKTAKGNLNVCLKEEINENEVDALRGRSEKYEDYAIACLNLADICIREAEMASKHAIHITKKADMLNVVEGHTED